VKGGEAFRAKAAKEAATIYGEVMPVIRRLKSEGKSLRQIAEALNVEEHSTVRGLAWNAMQVSRLLKVG
jgi:hypothetical protein